MIVKELVDILLRMDQKSVVVVADIDDSFTPIQNVVNVSLFDDGDMLWGEKTSDDEVPVNAVEIKF